MPTFRFDGLVPVDYPFAKDGRGQNLGRVEPGDEREFDTAPDQWWVPADGTDAPAASEDVPVPGAGGGAGEPGEHEAEAGAPAPETEPGF